MSGTIATIAKNVPDCCCACSCNKDGCRVDLAGSSKARVVVDMDCDSLPIPRSQRRCDYLFVGQEDNAIRVAPIEMKTGRLSANEVLEQLKGGALTADKWLPEKVEFQFVPILAHAKKIRRNNLRVLLSKKIQLRGQSRKTVLINCGDRLIDAFKESDT